MNISFRFILTDEQKPRCVLCYKTLFNESMQRAKVHKEFINKPAEYFRTRQLGRHTRKKSM